jgi:indolepyruvate ferredoxin oxidoreductase
MERQLIVDYARTIEELLPTLDSSNASLAAEIASVPEYIRGFGHVKEAHFAKAKAREAELLAAWRAPKQAQQAA